jgi:biofilm PGA synthesis lipoprotein PgaB
MKRTAVVLLLVLAGCITVEERPELSLIVSADHFTPGDDILLEVVVENTGSTGLHNVSVQLSPPEGFTCETSEYFIDQIEPGKEQSMYFDIHSPSSVQDDHTLYIFFQSDELTIKREFTLYQLYTTEDTKESEESIELIEEIEEDKEIPEKEYETIFGAQFDADDLYNTDVDTLIQQLKEAGVNTLVFRVFDYEYEPLSDCGVYFKTDMAPVKKDLLKEVVEKAHNEGIQVFAWMTTLDCPWVLADHPEWGVVAYNWETTEYETNASWWLRVSPFNREHREYLKKLYYDLAQYDIEGIVFQDDLYLKDNEDFSSFAAEAYKEEFKRTLSIFNMTDEYDNLTAEGETWVDWKCQTLMEMCQEIMEVVHTVNPDCAFLIDMFYEGVYSPEDCRRWFSQDPVLAVESGFDYLYVMSYHHFIAGDYGCTVDEALDLLGEMTVTGKELVGADKLIMKVQVYNWFTEKPVEDWEIEKAYTVLRRAGCRHIAYTPHHHEVPFHIIKKFSPQNNHSFWCV